MSNWLNSALKAVGETADTIAQNISETTSGAIETVKGWLPFSDEDTLAFFGVLFAVAAADGEISEDELNAIFSSPEVEKLSVEGKEKLQAYSQHPPSLQEAIAKLSQASAELKFGLVFYILNLAWVDGIVTSGEAEAIEIAREKLEIESRQIEAIEAFIKVLAKASSERDEEASAEVKAAIECMKQVGVPVEALEHLHEDPEKMEYSDAKFLEKMKAFGLQTGKRLVEEAFSMWYIMHESTVPTQAKLVVAGALAYWIFPVDMIPDILPAVGFSDDFSLIESAFVSIALCITPDMRLKAKEQTDALFAGKPFLESAEGGDLREGQA